MMKHEKQTVPKNSKAKKIIFRTVLVTILVCATAFIINLPKKIQNDYIKSLPENFQYAVSVGNKIEADSIDEINTYLTSFDKIVSQVNTAAISDDIKKKILKKSQSALKRLQLNNSDTTPDFLDVLKEISNRLSSYNESYIDEGSIEVYADIFTTDCYDNYNNISTVFFYNVNIEVFYPQWEQYNFYFSQNLENIFALIYSDGSDNGELLAGYTDDCGWYEYSADGSYLKINELFLYYLINGKEYDDGSYIPPEVH